MNLKNSLSHAIIILIKLLFLVFVFCSCENKNHLETYCSDLVRRSKPGCYTRAFTESNNLRSPEYYIIHSYNQLRSDWVYLSDMPGEDLVSNAEEIFKTHNFKGDCEDFAVCIMSFCRARNIDAVFCLGENKNKGHIWIEIPICLSKDYDDKLKKKINKLINRNISIYTQLGIVWLRFAHGEKLNNYKLEYKLDFKGNILKY